MEPTVSSRPGHCGSAMTTILGISAESAESINKDLISYGALCELRSKH